MSLLENLYEQDEDNPDLERVIEGNQDEGFNNDDNDRNSHSEAEEDAPRRVDPTAEKKTRVVKNPQFVLNPKRLTGPRGIRIIEDVFKDFTLLGAGHEKEDLDMVMKKLEHWAHRLYPKFQFDDCIDKIAHLGKKKEVSSHVRRIRMNILQEDDQPIIQNDEDDEQMPQEPVLDEFDLLLDQQIALARSAPPSAAKSTTSNFDSVLNRIETPDKSSFTNSQINNTASKPKAGSEISTMQRERMLQNRILAEERRLVRLKMQQEQTTSVNTSSNVESNENTTTIQNDVDMSS